MLSSLGALRRTIRARTAPLGKDLKARGARLRAPRPLSPNQRLQRKVEQQTRHSTITKADVRIYFRHPGLPSHRPATPSVPEQESVFGWADFALAVRGSQARLCPTSSFIRAIDGRRDTPGSSCNNHRSSGSPASSHSFKRLFNLTVNRMRHQLKGAIRLGIKEKLVRL